MALKFIEVLKVEAHIESLLYRYDCVIIPGFGGFVTNPRGAEIRKGNDQFSPPSREITFNENLTRNDGLLADAIAAKDQVTYNFAVQQIEEFNAENLERLATGNEVEFNGVGKFRRDGAGILAFEPSIKANFLRGSFGLSSFHSPTIRRDTVGHSIEKKILKALPKESPAQASSTVAQDRVNILKYWPAAAVIVIMIVSSTLLLKTDVLNHVSINYANLNPFADTIERVYQSRSEDRLPKEVDSGKDEIELWLESIPAEPIVIPKAVVKVVKRFHVIGGCFEHKVNANKLLRRLKRKGFEPQLVGSNKRGLHRVAFGSYETSWEARKALKKIKRNYMRSAWLYVAR